VQELKIHFLVVTPYGKHDIIELIKRIDGRNTPGSLQEKVFDCIRRIIMVKSATMYTYEIDSPERAFAEINEQLGSKITLMNHSVGIMLCAPDFIESGVVKDLCARFSFPVAGVTTSSQAVNGQMGDLMLTLMVLTSDDVEFAVGMTDSLDGGDLSVPVGNALEQAKEASDSALAMALIFPPLLELYPGDAYIEVFEKYCGKIPVFGTLAVDDSITFERSMTVCNGRSEHSALSFILMFGNVAPRFALATVSKKKLLPYTGEITRAQDVKILEINDLPASKYFESIGLAKNGVLHEGVQFIPFMMDVTRAEDYDGVPVVRALYRFDEDGSALCRGRMYEKSVFTLGSCSMEDVMETTLECVGKINDMDNAQAVILFSCIVRRMAFGVNPLAEAKGIKELLNPDLPFILGYSGGEICPTSIREHIAANRFHNYSFIACVL